MTVKILEDSGKRIWKFPLLNTDVQTLHIPKNAELLCVQVQQEGPCIWAMCDSEQVREERIFEIIGTGNPIPCSTLHRKYIGTYQLYSGSFVGHVFELRPVIALS